MIQSVTPIQEEQIRRAVVEAFKSHSLARQSIWQRIWEWILQQLARGVETVTVSRPVSVVLIIIAVLAAAAVIARALWLWREGSRVAAPGRSLVGALFRQADPWAQAQAFASRGDYTGAAHALYAALLESAARGQQVRLHPSKTVGDYSRELRSRRSQLSPRFRAFAGDYETVIYGDQRCDAERYERLFALAVPMLRANG